MQQILKALNSLYLLWTLNLQLTLHLLIILCCFSFIRCITACLLYFSDELHDHFSLGVHLPQNRRFKLRELLFQCQNHFLISLELMQKVANSFIIDVFRRFRPYGEVGISAVQIDNGHFLFIFWSTRMIHYQWFFHLVFLEDYRLPLFASGSGRSTFIQLQFR